MCIDRYSCDQGPDTEPPPSDDEDQLVPIQITPASCGEDEGTHSQRVAGSEPGELAGVRGVEGLADIGQRCDGDGETPLCQELRGYDGADEDQGVDYG